MAWMAHTLLDGSGDERSVRGSGLRRSVDNTSHHRPLRLAIKCVGDATRGRFLLLKRAAERVAFAFRIESAQRRPVERDLSATTRQRNLGSALHRALDSVNDVGP